MPLLGKYPTFSLVLSIPVINAIAAVTTNYFPAGTLNPGTVRAGLLLLFALYFIFNLYPKTKLSLFIIFALIYWGILALLSSHIEKSFYEYMKILFALLMFPVGYQLINTPCRLQKLTRIYIFVLVFYMGDILLANVLGYGTASYLEDSIHFGSGRVNITKSMIVLILVSPIAFLFEQKKNIKWIALIFIVGLLFTLVGIKRSVLLSAIVCSGVYFVISPFKGRLIKLGLILVLLLASVFSFYIDIFTERFDARGERVRVDETTFETEARYLEVIRVKQAWIDGPLRHKLFGSEFLNDTHFFNTRRMLHTDYMVILNGSGLIGLFIWFLLFYLIVKEKNRFYPYVKNDNTFRELNAVFWMLICAQLLISISGTVYDLGFRTSLFLYWGAIVGNMRFAAKKSFSQTQINSLIN